MMHDPKLEVLMGTILLHLLLHHMEVPPLGHLMGLDLLGLDLLGRDLLGLVLRLELQLAPVSQPIAHSSMPMDHSSRVELDHATVPSITLPSSCLKEHTGKMHLAPTPCMTI